MIQVQKSKLNRLLSIVLVLGISLTGASIALAVQANPGHGINTLGGVVQGDVLYGSGTDVVSALAKDINATRYLSNTGATNNPAWAQVNLANGVTGTIGTANLGSGTANSTTFLRGDSTWATPAAAGAPSTATYITQTADAGLSAEQALSALATGYMKVTTATGVVTSQATPIPAADGGTGLSTFGGANTVLYTSAANTLTNVAASGAAGQFLQTTASGGAPTWQTLLGVANGGTGVASLTANNVILGNGASGPLFVAPGTSGNLLQSNGTTWTSATPVNNYSTAAQALTAATLTYITGSKITVPVGKLRIGTMFRWTFDITKTAAGTAASTYNIVVGTLGTTGDTARVSFTKPAGTAVVDNGRITIDAIVRGPLSASGVMVGQFNLTHNLAATGHALIPAVNVTTVSGVFDVTVANLFVGITATTGASDAITIQMVKAEAINL